MKKEYTRNQLLAIEKYPENALQIWLYCANSY